MLSFLIKFLSFGSIAYILSNVDYLKILPEVSILLPYYFQIACVCQRLNALPSSAMILSASAISITSILMNHYAVSTLHLSSLVSCVSVFQTFLSLFGFHQLL